MCLLSQRAGTELSNKVPLLQGGIQIDRLPTTGFRVHLHGVAALLLMVEDRIGALILGAVRWLVREEGFLSAVLRHHRDSQLDGGIAAPTVRQLVHSDLPEVTLGTPTAQSIPLKNSAMADRSVKKLICRPAFSEVLKLVQRP